MKQVDRRPLTAALEPPLVRGGARRARACSGLYVAGRALERGPVRRAGGAAFLLAGASTSWAWRSSTRHLATTARGGLNPWVRHGRPTTARVHAAAVAKCAGDRLYDRRPPASAPPSWPRAWVPVHTRQPTTTPCTSASRRREERAPLETPEEGARGAAGSHLGRLGPTLTRPACEPCIARALRMVQPMGHLRLFLSPGPLEAGAVRRPPPSGCGR